MEITNIKAVINEIENRDTMEKNNEKKIWFFENIKTDKPFLDQAKKKD